MAKEIKSVTRSIDSKVVNELWARSAGRCQFNGCNKPLYKSPVTQESVNIAQKAHIYSFSEKGPRGWKDIFHSNKKAINNIDNLMLMCHDCHHLIDSDQEGVQYSAEQLQKWKAEHELRIATVTSFGPNNKSDMVFYGANIHEQNSPFCKDEAACAMFDNGMFPSSERPIVLSMDCTHEDCVPEYWATEEAHLGAIFNQIIKPLMSNRGRSHFSLFSLAPMPLLIKLGSLFTDKIAVDVYQPIRRPKTWKWQKNTGNFKFIVKKPESSTGIPVLVFSISAQIVHDRVHKVLGRKADIWELTVPDELCNNDNIRCKSQLQDFSSIVRGILDEINTKYSCDIPIHIFPAMSVSCSVELGRLRMPKADHTWIIFDQNNKHGKFMKSISIGDTK